MVDRKLLQEVLIALNEAWEYFDDKSDADDGCTVPNKELRLAMMLDDVCLAVGRELMEMENV